MRIKKNIEGAVRWLRLGPALLRHYGSLTPRRSRIPGSDRFVHIDMKDRRAVKRILFNSVRGRVPLNVPFWQDFVAALDPDLVVDIGANYGECVFSTVYAPNAHVFAFEANPDLVEYLSRSRAEHPSSRNITLVNAMVDESPRQNSDFYVHKRWSGGSKAVVDRDNPRDFRSVNVPVVSVDSVVMSRAISAERLVFKIDVEGFEPQVIKGMRTLLDRAEVAVGLVEFDLDALQESGWSLEEYDDLLASFQIFVPEKLKGSSVLAEGGQIPGFIEVYSLKDFFSTRPEVSHFDLILSKRGRVPKSVPAGWRLETI